METWLLIVLTVVIAFVVCMIIGFFGDKYLKKKDTVSKQNELQNSSDFNLVAEQNINVNDQGLNNSQNMSENKANAQMSGNDMTLQQSTVIQENPVLFEQISGTPTNGIVQNNTTNMFGGEQLIPEQNFSNGVNMINNTVPVQNMNNQLGQSIQSQSNMVNNTGVVPPTNGQLQQNWTDNTVNSTDPNLVPFDGNFSADDNINNMF